MRHHIFNRILISSLAPCNENLLKFEIQHKHSMISYSKNKTLHHSIKDGVYYSLMVGMGETYLAAYVLEIGYSEIFSGLVAVIPMLFGSIIQLFSAVFKDQILTKKKKWVVGSVILQAFSLIILSVSAFTKLTTPLLVLIVASVYWTAGLASISTWNAWLGGLIPLRIQIKFFSYRNQVCYIYLLLGLVVAGITLKFFQHSPQIHQIFGAIFLLSGVFRFISGYYLYLHSGEKKKEKLEPFNFKKSVSKLNDKQIIKIFGYVFVLQAATFISGPFVNPYLLNQLNFGYGHYMVLIGSALASRIFAYKYLGSFAKKRGAAALLMLGTAGVCPIPALWAISDNFFYIMAIQLLSGYFWAAYELGIFFVLLNKYKTEIRSDIITVLNFLNSLGMVFGTVIGAKILQIENLSGTAYVQIFLLSSMARVIPIIMLSQLLDLPIFTKKLTKKFLIRIIGIRPAAGIIIRPIFLDKKSRPNQETKNELGPKV